jgi:hypothetical protein
MALNLDVENLTLVTDEDRLGKLILAKAGALVARGWTVQGSGDGIATFQNAGQTAGPYNVFTSGTGYHNTGGVWAAALGGANKISNTRAWIRLREPSPSVREIIIQRSSTAATGFEAFMIEGMAYTGYLSNNATAVAPPTSAGVTQVRYGTAFNGAGADYITSIIAGTHTLVYNLLVSDVAKPGNVWPYIEFVYNSTLSTRVCGSVYESVVDAAPADAHPFVCATGLFTSVFGSPNVAPAMVFQGRRDDGVASTTFSVLAYSVTGFGAYPANIPATNADGKVRSLPIYVTNGVAADGRWKGRMEHCIMNMQSRNYPSTLDITTASPRLYLGVMMVPWKQNTVPGT